MVESKYAFYILSAFGMTFFILLLLGLQSRLRLNQLSKQYESLKQSRGGRRAASFPPVTPDPEKDA